MHPARMTGSHLARMAGSHLARTIGSYQASKNRKGDPHGSPFLMPHPRTAEAGGASCLPRKMPRRRKTEITREWQDLHAMHDLTVSDSNNASWWQDIRTVYSPTAFYRAFWIHGAHILPKLAVFEYMPAIRCHQEAFLPPVAPSGIHHGNLLP